MRTVFPALLVAAVVAASTQLPAAEEERAAGPRPAQLLKRLKEADANGDGVLDKTEVPDRLKERFDEADLNGDGKLDPEELKRVVAVLLKQTAPGMAQILQHVKTIDADGDGKLSLDEALEDAKKRFAKVDANGDGKLEKQELKPVLDAAVKQFPALAKIVPQELTATDTNEDHLLSLDEVIEKQKKDFARADADGDGKIDSRELMRAVAKLLKPPIPAQILKRFKAADANGDGKLSRDEAPDRIKERFDRIDANADGLIDLDELSKALAARGQRAQ